jgi:hypothetical protein
MNIELDEIVVMDVSDEALEIAADGAQGVAPHLPRLDFISTSNPIKTASCRC